MLNFWFLFIPPEPKDEAITSPQPRITGVPTFREVNLEAFEVDGATVPADEDASMQDQIMPGMDADDENESFGNELPGIPSMPAFN